MFAEKILIDFLRKQKTSRKTRTIRLRTFFGKYFC